MPTGYTACIGDGATFAEFLWRTARGFLWWCRDNDGPIPERIDPYALEYHEDEIAKAREELDRVEVMTPEQAESARLSELADHDRRAQESVDERARLRSQYNDMLALVEAWEIPTPDHARLKTYMIEQIHDSIRGDCADGAAYYREARERFPVDAGAWKMGKEYELRKSIAYHKDEAAKERLRADRTNAWIAALRVSVPQPIQIKSPAPD